MSKRRELKAVVNDLAQSLSSRNNDMNGYWAPGQLYSAISRAGGNHLSIDVMRRKLLPEVSEISDIADIYWNKVLTQISKRNIDPKFLCEIEVEYWFETELHDRIHRRASIGKPYIGKITIISDMGHRFSSKFGGYCAFHDPGKECRRVSF